MTLNGANVFFDTTDYTIYTMNSVNTGRYCVVLPKNNNGTYNMLVDLHMQNAFDSVSNGSKTKEQLVEEIKNEYMGVKTKYNDGILVLPMIDENLYANAVITNDKQKMFDKVKKIGAITSEIYKKLTDDGIDKQKIDQKIIIIIKNNDDIKFVDWLKEQMPDFVIGINLSELQANNNPFMANSNPFMANEQPSNDVFGPVAPVNNNSVDNNIFNTPSQENTPEPTNPVNDVFNPTATTSSEVVQPQPIPEQVATETVAPVQPVVEPTNTEVNNVQVTPAPSTETVNAEPAPVQATPLEATTTITPVQQPAGETAPVETPENIPAKKGSKGFGNLLILLVVLVGVTFISIELGKFLYNTYGV